MKFESFILGCLSLLWGCSIAFLFYLLIPTPEPVTVKTYAIEKNITPVEEVRGPAEEAEKVRELDPEEVELIGRTIWGEAEGVKDKAEQAAVAWCILNRVDTYGETVEEVVTAPKQFHGYRAEGECPQVHLDLAADVLGRWYAEKDGEEDAGRVLPVDYIYFIGDGERNHFSIEYQSTNFWDWSLSSPYITE